MILAKEIICKIAEQTDRAILFHSATGKDSIALLDLMAPHFKEIVCVFMYTVKNLRHINRYIAWAQRKYPNCRFIQIPHYGVYSWIKIGYMGCKKNPKQKKYVLSELNDKVREKTGIEWSFFGFKQSDSLNRRVMLRGYEQQAIFEKSKKVYPLSSYKNADVLAYIDRNSLITPEAYGGERQSSGSDINDIHYLLWLRNNYPDDLKKIYSVFPMVERLVFDYDNNNYGEETNKAE